MSPGRRSSLPAWAVRAGWRYGVLVLALVATRSAAAEAPAAGATTTSEDPSQREGRRPFDAGSAAYDLGQYALAADGAPALDLAVVLDTPAGGAPRL